MQRLEAYFWRITVTDDVVTNYEELGAATGTVDGEHTVSPPFPVEAAELAVVVQPNCTRNVSCYRSTIPTGAILRVESPSVHQGIPRGECVRPASAAPLRGRLDGEATDINNPPVSKDGTAASACLTLLRILRVRGLDTRPGHS